MLEECGFKLGKDWEAIAVGIGTGDQFKPEFLALSPNNKYLRWSTQWAPMANRLRYLNQARFCCT